MGFGDEGHSTRKGAQRPTAGRRPRQGVRSPGPRERGAGGVAGGSGGAEGARRAAGPGARVRAPPGAEGSVWVGCGKQARAGGGDEDWGRTLPAPPPAPGLQSPACPPLPRPPAALCRDLPRAAGLPLSVSSPPCVSGPLSRGSVSRGPLLWASVSCVPAFPCNPRPACLCVPTSCLRLPVHASPSLHLSGSTSLSARLSQPCWLQTSVGPSSVCALRPPPPSARVEGRGGGGVAAGAVCSQRKIDSCCHGDASAASETLSFRLGGEVGGHLDPEGGGRGAGARSQGLLEEGEAGTRSPRTEGRGPGPASGG